LGLYSKVEGRGKTGNVCGEDELEGGIRNDMSLLGRKRT